MPSGGGGIFGGYAYEYERLSKRHSPGVPGVGVPSSL